MAFTNTLKWPKCNSDKAMVGSVVCTVYTDGQPYKPCVLCQTGLSSLKQSGLASFSHSNAGFYHVLGRSVIEMNKMNICRVQWLSW